MSSHATSSNMSGARHRIKKSKITRELLLRCLEIIGTIQAPLPPELPPSPPASRSASPVPVPSASSSKRKLDTNDDVDSAKRPRTDKQLPAPVCVPTPSLSSASSSLSSVPIPAGSSSVSKSNRPHEAGNASSAAVGSSASGGTSSRSLMVYEPVRRPRHGVEGMDFRLMHKQYYQQARAFKYSGEARFLSTYPQSHSHYRPLREPPVKGTPYHTHGGLMALLEALEALLCFVYAAWCQDHNCSGFNDAWETIPSYLHWCKGKWASYVGNRESVREKSFIGLIHMIEAFTHQRIVRFKLSPQLEYKTKEYLYEIELEAKAKQASAEASRTTKAKLAPPEKSLPSPDTDAASANSTPANPSNSTPSNSNNENRSDEAKRAINKQPPTRPTEGAYITPDGVVSVKQSYIMSAKRLVGVQATASQEMKSSEKTLSLAIMREHFPRTFGRMVCSTLSAEEEYEPDMEDGEGELFWPSQCVTGDGIGWVCLMGRAMVREFGRDIGYTSMDAIVPKPGGTTSG